MSFVIPEMPLAINIWRAGTLVSAPPDVVSVCNLAYGKRVSILDEGATFGSISYIGAWVLLPKLVDVRDSTMPGGADQVEIPAGSRRYYMVDYVDDLGKGFPNEHRFAFCSKLAPWPSPAP